MQLLARGKALFGLGLAQSVPHRPSVWQPVFAATNAAHLPALGTNSGELTPAMTREDATAAATCPTSTLCALQTTTWADLRVQQDKCFWQGLPAGLRDPLCNTTEGLQLA